MKNHDNDAKAHQNKDEDNKIEDLNQEENRGDLIKINNGIEIEDLDREEDEEEE